MAITDADADKIIDRLLARKIPVGWPGKPSTLETVGFLLGNTYLQGKNTWVRIAALVKGLTGKQG